MTITAYSTFIEKHIGEAIAPEYDFVFVNNAPTGTILEVPLIDPDKTETPLLLEHGGGLAVIGNAQELLDSAMLCKLAAWEKLGVIEVLQDPHEVLKGCVEGS